MTDASTHAAGAPPASTATCGCCKGRGRVADIEGNPRPCSRCRPHDEFDAWYAAKRAAETEGSR